MQRNRFVTAVTKKIDISDDDWIVVKSELDTGDQRKQDSLAVVPTMVDGKIVDRTDWSMYEILRTRLWLVDWSLTKKNAEGKVVSVPVSVQAIKELDPEDFEEINQVIFAHIMAWIQEKKRRKQERISALPSSSVEPTSA